MTLRAIVYAYVLGGLTFIPLVILAAISYTIYTSVPVGAPNSTTTQAQQKPKISATDAFREKTESASGEASGRKSSSSSGSTSSLPLAVDEPPKTRKGWLSVRRQYEEPTTDGSYVMLVRSFLDARSKDPKRSRPKDMWYAVLKGTVMYLYEDEGMTECEAAIEVGGHDVVIYPEGLLDGELFARRNAICLRPRVSSSSSSQTTADGKDQGAMPSVTRDMKYEDETLDQLEAELEAMSGANTPKKKGKEREKLIEAIKKRKAAREAALASTTPWFIFVRSNVEMEDWYLSLVHASDCPPNTPALTTLQDVFQPADMLHLLMTLDEQPDVVPMRWLNALMGRIFFSYYRTRALEDEIIRRLMKKLSKVKRPAFLTDVLVTEVSVGNKAPFFSKPMLKELTKEGDASMQVHLYYKGEIRITIAATATINLGARFKSYVVKLTLAAVLKELEGNLLIKVKRPPSSRIWYAFTQTPRMVLDVEPIVSDRQITWSMILHSIESKLMEIIQESVVMPNMDDISFFESSSYKRRGGIWPDASRYERKAPPPAEPTIPSTPAATASAPVIDDTVTESNTAALKHSRSVEDLASSATEPLVSRSSTDSSRPPSRRSTDSSSLLQVPSINDDERGKSDTETTASARSRPLLRKKRSALFDSDTSKEGEESRPRRLPGLLRRMPSQQSSLADLPPQSANSSSSSLHQPASISSKNSDSSRFAPPSPSTSFFSSLKSRAGDKQALSNTAKEAMRKWGVNWGAGHKKNSMSDDIPDQESPELRRRVESESGASLAQRAKASYAEIRAAVAERAKGKDEEGLRSPIPISTIHQPMNATVKTSEQSNQGYIFTSEAVLSASPRSRAASLEISRTPPKARAPSITRTITERSANSGSEDAVAVADDPATSQPMIHTQPMQARTMSIPGIHASHRGDVMSMGHVAPSETVPAETMPKSTTIQTVYRLWKSPVLSAQQPQGAGESSSALSPPVLGGSTDGNRDVIPLLLTPSTPSPTSPPRPPPLPPRSTTAAATLAPQLLRDPRDKMVGMSASEALKFIADMDESKRASLERSPGGLSASRPVSVDVEGLMTTSVAVGKREVNGDADPVGKTDSGSSSPDTRAPLTARSVSTPGPPLPPRSSRRKSTTSLA